MYVNKRVSKTALLKSFTMHINSNITTYRKDNWIWPAYTHIYIHMHTYARTRTHTQWLVAPEMYKLISTLDLDKHPTGSKSPYMTH